MSGLGVGSVEGLAGAASMTEGAALWRGGNVVGGFARAGTEGGTERRCIHCRGGCVNKRGSVGRTKMVGWVAGERLGANEYCMSMTAGETGAVPMSGAAVDWWAR